MAEQRYPEPTVGALIFNADGKLFLMRSHKWRGKWVVPGGHIELGETMEQALRREIREETGLEIRDIEFICFQEFIHDERFWRRRHFIFFDYACRTDSTEVVLNDEAQDYAWIDLDRAMAMPVERYTAVAIAEYRKKRR